MISLQLSLAAAFEQVENTRSAAKPNKTFKSERSVRIRPRIFAQWPLSNHCLVTSCIQGHTRDFFLAISSDLQIFWPALCGLMPRTEPRRSFSLVFWTDVQRGQGQCSLKNPNISSIGTNIRLPEASLIWTRQAVVTSEMRCEASATFTVKAPIRPAVPPTQGNPPRLSRHVTPECIPPVSASSLRTWFWRGWWHLQVGGRALLGLRCSF